MDRAIKWFVVQSHAGLRREDQGQSALCVWGNALKNEREPNNSSSEIPSLFH